MFEKKLLSIAAASLILSACSKSTSGPDKGNSMIVDGSGAIDAEIKASTVALLRDGKPTCSGVIVGTNAILTAQHCFLTSHDIDRYEVAFGNDLDSPDLQKRSVESITTYANGANGQPVKTFLPLGDIAVVRWSGNAFEGMKPALVADDTFEFQAKSKLLIAGFGAQSAHDDHMSFKLKQGETLVEKIFTNGPFRGLLTYGKGASGTCFGDSGGPAFVAGTSGLRLVGLTQGASATLNSDGDFYSTNDPCSLKVGIYTMVSFYGRWLQDQDIATEGRFRERAPQTIDQFENWEGLCAATDLSLQSTHDLRRLLLLLGKDSDCLAIASQLDKVTEVKFPWHAPSDLEILKFLPNLRKLELTRISQQLSMKGLSHLKNLQELKLDDSRNLTDQFHISESVGLKKLSWIMNDRMDPADYPAADQHAFDNLPPHLQSLSLSRVKLKYLKSLPISLEFLKVTGAGIESIEALDSLGSLEFLDLSNNGLKSFPILGSPVKLKSAILSANFLDAIPLIPAEAGTIVLFDENPIAEIFQ